MLRDHGNIDHGDAVGIVMGSELMKSESEKLGRKRYSDVSLLG